MIDMPWRLRIPELEREMEERRLVDVDFTQVATGPGGLRSEPVSTLRAEDVPLHVLGSDHRQQEPSGVAEPRQFT